MITSLLLGCNQESADNTVVEQSSTEANIVSQEQEVTITTTPEPVETMDSSMKEETCTISAKAIETIDHHGNELLIMRSEDEDYLDSSQGFSILEITEELKEKMINVSWKEGCPVALKDLRYVQVLFKGFDNNVHIGGLIVHEKVSEEIMVLFQSFYDSDFKIEKVRPIYHYGANDDLSMEDNNTSAFNYRVVEGSSNLSKHSYGIALDINPIQNPFVRGDHVSPEAGKAFTDRSMSEVGMIIEGDPCHKGFKDNNWTWGGDWNTMKDYQHFQKNIDLKEVTSK